MKFNQMVRELKRLRKLGYEKDEALPALLDPDDPIEADMLRAREVAFDPHACVCNDCLESEAV